MREIEERLIELVDRLSLEERPTLPEEPDERILLIAGSRIAEGVKRHALRTMNDIVQG